MHRVHDHAAACADVPQEQRRADGDTVVAVDAQRHRRRRWWWVVAPGHGLHREVGLCELAESRLHRRIAPALDVDAAARVDVELDHRRLAILAQPRRQHELTPAHPGVLDEEFRQCRRDRLEELAPKIRREQVERPRLRPRARVHRDDALVLDEHQPVARLDHAPIHRLVLEPQVRPDHHVPREALVLEIDLHHAKHVYALRVAVAERQRRLVPLHDHVVPVHRIALDRLQHDVTERDAPVREHVQRLPVADVDRGVARGGRGPRRVPTTHGELGRGCCLARRRGLAVRGRARSRERRRRRARGRASEQREHHRCEGPESHARVATHRPCQPVRGRLSRRYTVDPRPDSAPTTRLGSHISSNSASGPSSAPLIGSSSNTRTPCLRAPSTSWSDRRYPWCCPRSGSC